MTPWDVGEDETFLRGWLTSSVRLRCRPRTADSYAETVERYIVPAIGQISLSKLTPEHVARMLADLTIREAKSGRLSPTTVRYFYTVLHIVLGRALKSGKVIRNVASLVDAPSKAVPELRPLTGDEVATFLDSIEGGRLRAMYFAAIGLGLRQGELLGLPWSDVDLAVGTATVRRTLQISTRS